jgi:hypothetical protein
VDCCLLVYRMRHIEGPGQLREALDAVLGALSSESAYSLVRSFITQDSTPQIPWPPATKHSPLKASIAPFIVAAAALFIPIALLVWGASRYIDKKQSPQKSIAHTPRKSAQ